MSTTARRKGKTTVRSPSYRVQIFNRTRRGPKVNNPENRYNQMQDELRNVFLLRVTATVEGVRSFDPTVSVATVEERED